MSIVKLRIGHDGICEAVPAQLWELGDKPDTYAVVFSDRKPRHTTGVYRFERAADPRYIRVIGLLKAAREWAAGYNGSAYPQDFYLMDRARGQLWGEPGEVPKSGYVWAEEV